MKTKFRDNGSKQPIVSRQVLAKVGWMAVFIIGMMFAKIIAQP